MRRNEASVRFRRPAHSTVVASAVVFGLLLSTVVVGRSVMVSRAAVGAGSVTEVQVTGRAGIPADASAVAINLAAINPTNDGFLTAYPCGTTRPTTSTVNHDRSAATSNAAVVGIGTGGKICIYSLATSDIIVDVTGWFPANADYTPITPDRLLDTRPAAPPTPPTPGGDDGGSGAPPPGVGAAGFFEDFTGNTGLENFETGVFHRAEERKIPSWSGDHDMDCGSPATQRVVRADRPEETFYLCRDHLMTSVGDVAGYSIAWFSPRQTFEAGTHTRVSFDVNVTDLGGRKWWEVSITPLGAPHLATVDWVASIANVDAYTYDTIAIGTGPLGRDGAIFTQGVERDPLGISHVCGLAAVDPEGCASKAIRRTFTITDNRNGTITVDFLGAQYTYPGTFPDQFHVYFKDHSYAPDKDGVPVGYTWHWDNILVT